MVMFISERYLLTLKCYFNGYFLMQFFDFLERNFEIKSPFELKIKEAIIIEDIKSKVYRSTRL